MYMNFVNSKFLLEYSLPFTFNVITDYCVMLCRTLPTLFF